MTISQDILANHPLINATLEEKILYLYALGLTAYADGHTDDSELEYIKALANTFAIDAGTKEDLFDFVQNPSTDIIDEIRTTLHKNAVVINLIYDAYYLSDRDGHIADSEIKVIKKLTTELGYPIALADNIRQLYDCLQQTDVAKLSDIADLFSLEERARLAYLNKDINPVEEISQDVSEATIVEKEEPEKDMSKRETVAPKPKKIIKPLYEFFEEANIADGKDFYLGDYSYKGKLSKKKKNAIESYAHDDTDYKDEPWDDLLLLLDTTLFGSATEGMYITESTIYMKEFLEDRLNPINIKDIRRIYIPRDNDETYIEINGKTFNYVQSDLRARMRRLVTAIKEYLAQFDNEENT